MTKGEKETRGTKRDLMSLFRDSLYEQPAADAAYMTFEMQSMAPDEGEEKKPRSKGKKKADKGKAIDRDLRLTRKRSSKEIEKRREVEPGKFATNHYFKNWFKFRKGGLLGLTRKRMDRRRSRPSFGSFRRFGKSEP